MQDVGTFLDRNKTFSKNFTRKTIISECFKGKTHPIILDISLNPMNGRTDWVEVFYKRVKK